MAPGSVVGRSRQGRRSVHLSIILVVAVLAYVGTLRGTFDFDTPNLLLDNRAVHGLSLANLRAIVTGLPNGADYLPVRDLTYMLDFELWGLRAAGYHLSNVVYYAGACAVLFLLLERVAECWTDRPRALATLATLLFALHPVHVESVAGIAQRKDVVSGLLLFASLFAFRRWATDGRARRYVTAFALFVLAVLAKETAIVGPGLAVLVAPPRSWRERRLQLGVAGLAAAALALAVLLAGQAARNGVLYDDPIPAWLRILTYARAAAWYARMLIFPWPLSVLHDVRPVTAALEPGPLAALAIIGALTVFAVVRARRYPVLAFSLGWFLVAIVPVSGLLPAPNLVAERYLFLPSVGFALAVAWLTLGALAPRSRVLASVATGALAVAYSGVVVTRLGEWRTNGGLLAADVSRNPGFARLTAALGRYHFANGRHEEAFAAFERARRLDPADTTGVLFAAIARLQASDPAGAVEQLERLTDDPTIDVQCLHGMALERMGRVDDARARYERALRANRLMGVIFRTEAEAGLARLARPGSL
jgi:tetratricopeptide (TPR) repeat protein